MASPDRMRADYHGLVRQDVLPLMPTGGGRLLDLGGGVGATAAWLKAQGRCKVAGVIDQVADAPAAGLDFAEAGDLEDLRFLRRVVDKHGPFETVLCLDVLEHLRDPWTVVRTLHRGLVPGGRIIASIPNVRNFKALLPLLLLNRWTLTDAGVLDRTHLRFFVRSTALDLMTHSGLELEDVRAKPSGGRSVRMFRALTLGLMNSFTDLQYLIRVRAPDQPVTVQKALPGFALAGG
ncbi:MAG: methyltransferase domain-containing protein [Pseudomonadota bacterium]